MSAFVDQWMLQFSDPSKWLALLAPSPAPASDPSHLRLRTLFSAVYQLPATAIVQDVTTDAVKTQVRSLVIQRPVFAPKRVQGVWTQTSPTYARTDVAYDGSPDSQPIWVDASAEIVGLTAVVNFVDADAIASFALRRGTDSTGSYQYAADLTLAPPQGPGTPVPFSVNVAVLLRETVDLAAVLRDAKLARGALERSVAFQGDEGGPEMLTPYAPVVVFPGPEPTNVAALQSFFAAQGVLVLFQSPS
jgi:hypothetical protein